MIVDLVTRKTRKLRQTHTVVTKIGDSVSTNGSSADKILDDIHSNYACAYNILLKIIIFLLFIKFLRHCTLPWSSCAT